MSCINEHSYLTLCNLLCDQIALSLPPDKVYLAEARLQNLARQHTQGDINALIEKASSIADDALRTELVEAMAIHETFFFRDPILGQSFLDTMIPSLLEKRRADRTLRIWSAACSTGQEAYSVAMLLDEHFPQLKDWEVTLVASDFSQSALNKAQRGCYGLNEMNRGLPARNMALYFEQQGLDWQVKPAIRERIRFEKINLVREWPEDLPVFDIVLLRNVLLYFSIEDRQRVLKRIRKQTANDGYLLLGSTESLEKSAGFVPAISGSHRPFYQPA
ncbi:MULTISPECIES: protein-glutamate O-methyltransferase CheR [Alcanivorax]|uniref:CheR family methyltransferase n=1 Tax=Alcanivorax TaxID=59753 RepID=UPI0025C56C50|nr:MULTISPECIES: protein-glutamate O-methyltransferase CheR [Alcanivorax]